jgi:hypothetical protein
MTEASIQSQPKPTPPPPPPPAPPDLGHPETLGIFNFRFLKKDSRNKSRRDTDPS